MARRVVILSLKIAGIVCVGFALTYGVVVFSVLRAEWPVSSESDTLEVLEDGMLRRVVSVYEGRTSLLTCRGATEHGTYRGKPSLAQVQGFADTYSTGVFSQSSPAAPRFASRSLALLREGERKIELLGAGWPVRCFDYRLSRSLLRGAQRRARPLQPFLTEYEGASGFPSFLQDYRRNPEWKRALPIRPIWGGLIANVAVYSLLVGVLFFGPGVVRRGLQRRRGLCVKCGYELPIEEGLAVCPECGTRRGSAGEGDDEGN